MSSEAKQTRERLEAKRKEIEDNISNTYLQELEKCFLLASQGSIELNVRKGTFRH